MKRFLSVMLCLLLIAGLIAVPVEAKNKTKKNKTKTETTFNAKTAKKNIKVKYIRTGEGILAIYKNKNNYAVALTASIKYVDVAGNSLLEDSVENPCIGKKKTMAYFFRGPVDDNNSFMNYRDFSGTISVEKTKKTDKTDNITITTELDTARCKCLAMNTSTTDLESISATLVFYDASGNIIAGRNQYVDCTYASSATEFTVDYPGLSQPASVKVYKNWAY